MSVEKEKKIGTITLTQLKVDGKNFTKSYFNQLIEEIGISRNFEFIGQSRFGYVKDKNNIWMLFTTKENQLRKQRITELIQLNYGDHDPRFEKCNAIIDEYKNNQIFL